jgi:hypothetical protein
MNHHTGTGTAMIPIPGILYGEKTKTKQNLVDMQYPRAQKHTRTSGKTVTSTGTVTYFPGNGQQEPRIDEEKDHGALFLKQKATSANKKSTHSVYEAMRPSSVALYSSEPPSHSEFHTRNVSCPCPLVTRVQRGENAQL